MMFMKTIMMTVFIPLFVLTACSSAGPAAEEPPFAPEPQEEEAPTAEPEPQNQDETEPEPTTAVSPSSTPPPLADEETEEPTQNAIDQFNETREAGGLAGTRADPEDLIISPTVGESAEPSSEDENVKSAKEDLSEKLDVPVENIELINVEQVMWRDGSLGCPQPKTNYIQVIQEGYRIQLSADGQIYHYHGVFGQPPFLCER